MLSQSVSIDTIENAINREEGKVKITYKAVYELGDQVGEKIESRVYDLHDWKIEVGESPSVRIKGDDGLFHPKKQLLFWEKRWSHISIPTEYADLFDLINVEIVA